MRRTSSITKCHVIFLCLMMTILFSFTLFAQDEVKEEKEEQILTSYGILVNTMGRDYINHQSANKMVETITRAGFNFFIPEVRENGTLYYLSSVENRSEKIIADYLDPLTDLLTMAQFPSIPGAGIMEVYPGIDLLQVYDGKRDPFPPKNSTLMEKTEWLSLTFAGEQTDDSKLYILDPVLPKVQAYTEKLLIELVIKYEVSGLYLDNICYPNNSWGYNKEALKLFLTETGMQDPPAPNNEEWCDWRRNKVTEYLKRIVSGVKEAKPDLTIIAAVEVDGIPPDSKEDFSNSPPYTDNLQDWVTWAEEGLVDAICLKNYWRDYTEGAKFNGWLHFVSTLESEAAIWVAIGGSLNFSDNILDQTRRARQINPQAVILNNYRNATRDNRDTLFANISRAFSTTLETSIPRFSEDQLSPSLKYVAPVVDEIDTTTGTIMTIGLTDTTTPTLTVEEIMEKAEEEKAAEETVSPATPEPSPTPRAPVIKPTPIEYKIIYLTNGNIIKGRIIDKINKDVFIETSEGMKLNLKESEIEKVEKQ